MKFLFFMMFNALIFSFLQYSVVCVNGKGDNSLAMQSLILKTNIEDLKNQMKHEIKNDNEFLKKKEEPVVRIINAVQGNPIVRIESIDTQILVKKHKTDGEVSEKVKFVLQDGVFDTLIRKVSLGGTSDKQIGFKLASSDIVLTGAKIISNCMEPSSLYEHPYVCVIANFHPVDATTKPKQIEIEYEYTSQNLLRRREKPFSSHEKENVIVWIYDNNKKDTSIEIINLSVKFEDEIDLNKLIAYPERFLLKHQLNKTSTSISWTIKDIKPNSFKNFALNIPIFNRSCKGMVINFYII